ncbi:uncharacterized protein [Spinacia oleracea]|uniref:DUF4283 domain-containing protein n=1 Tax=Spinacia oleracea TaxID=3562 RepID=A0A9R0HRV1_SPIOL|nr:uncharacterized protein LOC110775541 [Spinacia oleracea]
MEGGSDGTPKPTETWANKVKGSSIASKGKALSFVAPVCTDGKVIACLQQSELNRCNSLWSNAVVMFVIGETPTIASVMRFITKEWNHVAMPKVFLHDEGYFVLKFGSVEDKDAVLFAGPHFFYGKPTILKQWSPSFHFHEEVLKVIPLWIKFPNLPLNCWGEDSLSRLSSVVGVPLYADECTSQQLRISFARVLVEVDVTRPLPSSITVADPSGQEFEQAIEYEWKPEYCKKCCMVGHNCNVKVFKAAAPVKKVVEYHLTPVGNNVEAHETTEWKVDARRTKHREERPVLKGTPVQNSFSLLSMEQQDENINGVEEENEGGVSGFINHPG